MSEPVLYMRGFPSPFFGPSSISPAMLQDLRAVAGLSEDQADAIRTRLAEATGFLGPKELFALLRELLSEEATARAVQRTVRNIDPNGVEPLLKTLAKSRSDEEPTLDQAMLARLQKILPHLIQPCPALARYKKAERLATLTGRKLEAAELICDLRPVFDERRTCIEGMMPYTRLRMVATGADGLPEAFEAELTRQQVHDLAEKASKAVQKLDALVDVIQAKWLPSGLPDLPLTRPPQKDPGNA